MRTNVIVSVLCAVMISSCASPHYLPSTDEIDVNEYGSNINIVRKKASNITGELIAIDNTKIVVLTDYKNKCITVPVKDVIRFRLRYAKPKHYGWTIPLYTLATITHGFFLLITAPLNLIVTISVTVTGETAYVYNKNKITYDELKMFARYPQGIPQNIDMARIK